MGVEGRTGCALLQLLLVAGVGGLQSAAEAIRLGACAVQGGGHLLPLRCSLHTPRTAALCALPFRS